MTGTPDYTSTGFSPAAIRYERLLLALCFLAFGFVFFDRQAVTFLAPYIDAEFGLNNTQLGALAGTTALTWALSGMVAANLSDRLGRRVPILIGSILLFSTFSAMSGLMTGFIGLLVMRALMGAAEGAVLPMAQSLMAQASRPERRGMNMGILQGSSAGIGGGILAPIIVVAVAEATDWRTAFYVTLVPGLVMAFLVWRYVKERPPHPIPTMSVEESERPKEKVGFSTVLQHRNIWICMLIAVVYLTWFITLITFTPRYLGSVKHLGPGDITLIMTCIGIAWAFWGFLAAALSDRFGRKAALGGCTVLAALCPFAVMHIDNVWLLAIVMVITYTGNGCFTLFMATIPAETVPPAALATALALIMGVGEIAGGFIGPVVSGWASDQWGLQTAMYIASAGAVVVIILTMFLTETAPRFRDAKPELVK